MPNLREEKIISLFKELFSGFFARLGLEKTIITVTRINLSKNLKQACVSLSVYPETNEKMVINKLRGEKRKISTYMSSKTSLKFLPKFQFEIDKGEKNRQRIEELLKQK